MVADPARSRMLAYLLTGEFASAGELAAVASVSPATASGHLARLLAAQFLVCEPRGRHRDYRLADAEVAHALEALALVAERDPHDRARRASGAGMPIAAWTGPSGATTSPATCAGRADARWKSPRKAGWRCCRD